ncbi:MAG: Ig domain-containing protein, partial [Anaerolineae bacterium]|nr:Ig domain-containing protein [Anaerolineae bacterium]
PLTYSATGLPPNLAINPSTGEITGTVAISSAGTYSVTVTVTDGAFNVDTAFTWTIEVGGPVTGNDTDFFIDNVKLTFCTTQPAPAQLPSLGKLSGKLKLGGTPQAGVTVWAYAYDDGFQAPGPVHTTYSINDGSYNFYNLEPGSYLIYTGMTISNTTYFDSALRSIGPGSDVRNVNLNLQTN